MHFNTMQSRLLTLNLLSGSVDEYHDKLMLPEIFPVI